MTTGGSSHQEGRYYGRFAVKHGVDVTGGADATTIVIQNAGDVPVSSKTVKLTESSASPSELRRLDARRGGELRRPGATLTVKGYGAWPAARPASTGVDAPPHVVTVTSSEGGSVTVPLGTSGSFTAPDLPVAAVVASPTHRSRASP